MSRAKPAKVPSMAPTIVAADEPDEALPRMEEVVAGDAVAVDEAAVVVEEVHPCL